ncbi:molecular chaperone HtpG [Candidatus Margulisiibacteriota bacterium]
MPTKEKIKKSGDLQIHTENIFPIIKKWLYSDKEIFLRELMSNAFDAIKKLKKIALTEGLKKIDTEGKIQIKIDKKTKTLTISDNGLGMDAEEIEKYINQIAFSGAEDFMEKYKDEAEKNQIIGHFGLGFYSTYMVADLVEINTLSYKKGAQAIKWHCDGSTHFTIEESKRDTIGTDIIIYLNDDNKEFLEETRITTLVKKYANFLPVEIKVEDNIVNDQHPLWIKQPNEVKEKEYEEFYNKLFPFSEPPLFHIHLNVDYPFNLKGILYFPKLQHELDSSKGQIQLFCQQVFVSDHVKEVIPEFLTLLRGAIDTPDIPLNVSRSYLQNDPYVQKISKHIVKKVADKLIELFKKDKANFEKYWEDIHPFIKFGMMNNTDFYEKVKDIVIFKSSNGYSTSIPEYLERNKEKLKDTVLYALDQEAQSTYLNLCKEQGLEVIYLNTMIDTHFIQFLEMKDMKIKYKAIDTDLSEHLIDKTKESKVVDKDNKTAADKTAEIFKDILKNDKLKIEVKSLKSETTPAIILESEHSKRMKSMSAMMKGANMPMLEDYTLVVNSNNKIIQNIEKSGKNAKDTELYCKYVYDLALLSQKKLTGAEMQAFMDRSNEILTRLSGKE